MNSFSKTRSLRLGQYKKHGHLKVNVVPEAFLSICTNRLIGILLYDIQYTYQILQLHSKSRNVTLDYYYTSTRRITLSSLKIVILFLLIT